MMRDFIASCTLFLGLICIPNAYAKPGTKYTSNDVAALVQRARPDAPSGYAPKDVDCPPTRPNVRQASDLSPEELDWLPRRRNATVSPMRDLLNRLDVVGFDANSYMEQVGDNATILPNIGLAFSGGGYRALLNGAGALAAFDNRTSHSNDNGHLGGLLQASTYIAGLSGGSWLVGSIFMNNFTSVESILDKNDDPNKNPLWRFDLPITMGPVGLSSSEYLGSIAEEVAAKKAAGYNTSITDAWGRALSYQLIDPVDGGVSYTFSSIAKDNVFKSGGTPMPVFVADGRAPGELIIDGNATVYEINPWELGSFDPTTFAFAPLEYLGSDFLDGKISSKGKCVRGFDNAGYMMGTSSSLFNQGLLQYQGKSGILSTLATHFLGGIDEDGNDVANYPNPFQGVNPQSSRVHGEKILTLVDGGEDLQNLPLHPLTQPQRNVDVIFAIDSSADTLKDNGELNWPNGTALVATYARSLLPIANDTAFPAIPDVNTFVNLGLNNRPVFFGCDATNTTSPTPLVVYIPNAPYSYLSNFSTFQMGYTHGDYSKIIENGYNVATMGNATTNKQWPTCVGCAILQRSLSRIGAAFPDACQACFKDFCWDGSIDTSEATYNPEMKLKSTTEGEISNAEGFAVNKFRVIAVLMLVLSLIV